VLFINYDIDTAEKKKLIEWRVKYDEQVFDLLNDLAEKKYQISVKYDAFNECIGAFLICKDEKSENNGFILTGRGSTAQNALMGVLYRHYAVFEEAWPTHNHGRGATDDID
jgi:hypothetical protein